MKKCCELLAPAGSFESVYAAVQSGADAIYIGGNMFSARASAGNFTNEEIKEVVDYCHLRGVKVHAALNTLIKQDEFRDAFDFAVFLYNSGVDAIIVQDIGLAMAIKESIPDFEIHGSTQMTIHNADDAKILKKLGFSRVVVSRELSFEEIQKIKAESGIEVEIFVHGAICQSYSGQCLFSSILGGRSGNRGRCAQPCRLEYEFLSGDKSLKRGYLLSPKDMCLVGQLSKIKDLGIDSLKIEGRLKKGEYVAAVVSVYRKYLDTNARISDKDYNVLLNAFNRSGFTDGYFTGRLGAEMMSYSSPSNIAEEKFDADILNLISPNANERKIKIEMQLTMKTGEKTELRIVDEDGNSICVSGNECEKAISRPADIVYVKKQLTRLGNTVFSINNFEAVIEEGLGIGASELNDLRRRACERLSEKRTEVKRFSNAVCEAGKASAKIQNDLKISVQVYTAQQAAIALKYNVDRIYMPEFLFKTFKDNDKIYLKCDDISQVTDCNTENILSAHLSNGKDGAVGDFRLNVYNSESIKVYSKLGFEGVCISPELNLNEIRKIDADLSACELIAYGKLPLMLMKNCVIKSVRGKCGFDNKSLFSLKDRKRERFTILCNGKASCTNTLLNSKPIYMADKITDIKKAGVGYIRLMFWDETVEECEQVLRAYIAAVAGEAFKVPECGKENKFTRGHFFRGVI